MHDRHIAHFVRIYVFLPVSIAAHGVVQDLRPDNLLYARRRDVEYHKEIELGKLYIIDFSESRQLSLGPGRQLPVDLPQSIIPKPLDMQRLDPYAFDVYCLGMVVDVSLAVRVPCRDGSRKADETIIRYSWFTNCDPNHGFCSATHGGSSAQSEDARVSVIVDRPLDEPDRSLSWYSGSFVG